MYIYYINFAAYLYAPSNYKEHQYPPLCVGQFSPVLSVHYAIKTSRVQHIAVTSI